jgi:hypothetical protein
MHYFLALSIPYMIRQGGLLLSVPKTHFSVGSEQPHATQSYFYGCLIIIIIIRRRRRRRRRERLFEMPVLIKIILFIHGRETL